MHINCPHCQNPIEVVESAALKEIVCPSCGSSFSTSNLQTKSYHARRRRSRKSAVSS
jgi:DNA-directed RNA polymerase subunit M/transcription elongation factor TFIIS